MTKLNINCFSTHLRIFRQDKVLQTYDIESESVPPAGPDGGGYPGAAGGGGGGGGCVRLLAGQVEPLRCAVLCL